MKRLLLIITIISHQLFAQSPAHEMNKKLGIGYNFGNVMSANNEGDWAAPIEKYMIDDVAASGFDHIRLPVRWGSHTSNDAPYTVDAAWLTRVEEVVDWANEAGLIVVLNAHGEHWFLDEVSKDDEVYPIPQYWERMLSIWTQISEHFKDKSNDKLVFELINEPYFKMGQGLVDKLNKELLQIVRQNNSDRIIMLTGGGDNAINSPQMLDPEVFANDNKLIPWFHYYWPNTFTKYPEIEGSKPFWGSPDDYQNLKRDFQEVKDWADTHNVPVYLGEFGSNNSCDEQSRIRYHKAVADVSRSMGFSAALWCAGPKANKMIYTREGRQWLPGHVDALLKTDQKKNVLFIVIDDMNTDLFAFGNEEVITPTIDKLSTNGIQYTNAQCSYPVCGPSRASFLTGTYPERNGVTNLTLQLSETAPDLTTLPELLSRNGYRTAAVGKVFDPRNVDGNHHDIAWTDNYKDPNHYEYPEEYGPFVKGTSYRVEADMSTEIGPAHVDDDGYQDGQFADHAIEYIDHFSKVEQPFFLAVGFKKPHLPFIAPQKYHDLYNENTLTLAPFQKMPEGTDAFTYKDPTELLGYKDIPQEWETEYNGFQNVLELEKQRELLRSYYACASYIDAQIGKIVTKLEEVGEAENTLIVITSDHGFNLGDHNMWGKHNLLQNASQVPLIIIDPTDILKGTDRSVQLIDLYPTICDYTNTPKPEFLQGNSLYIADYQETDYPLDLSVTYYKKSGSNGYTFKKGNDRYTMWTNDRSMSPIETSFQNITLRHEEFYTYNSIQELETKNEINNPSYQNRINELRRLAEVWWNRYYGQTHQNDTENLILVNPNFEEGIENGWSTTHKADAEIQYELRSEPFPSNNTLGATMDIQSNGGAFSNLTLRTDQYPIGYTVSNPKEMIISFDVYSSVDTEIRAQIQGDNGDRINGPTQLIQKDTPLEVVTRVNSTTGMSAFRLAIQLGKTVGVIHFDNVKVTIEDDVEQMNQLKEAIEALKIGYAEGDSKNNVNNNLWLEQEGLHGTKVAWNSSDENALQILNDSGIVTKDYFPHVVVLQAEVSLNNLKETKTFVIKVNQMFSNEMNGILEEVQLIYQGDDSSDGVTQDILIHEPSSNANIQWISSDNETASIEDDLIKITQLEEQTDIEITAVVTLGDEVAEKQFYFTVLGIEPPTSIPEQNGYIKVYPNPVQHQIVIQKQDNNPIQLLMYSVEGKVILKQTIQLPKETIDVSHLQRGVYILKIGSHSHRVIKY
ncbi:sulfatase-like hydrolase/transferase [Flammeovirga sp. MY04]|uniref:sulfatase-like hydrolase/transferase n=1 Tax=Flammeovirga sp. MY04 TaxID=1191459 RepID=UPI0008060DEB|nr:sulfatase-like hydrolase/transferase [Flammeovirga sp. MY04]ANQ52487.1 sulfatase-like hydrolase/transferase [Flammeovirga sp. MY04]